MLTYKFPWLYELGFKFPPLLIWRKKSIRFLVEAIHSLPIQPTSILDLGCGAGVLAPILRKLYPKSEIVGIDISPHMIGLANKRYGNLAKFRVADFFNYEDKHDLIIGFYSLVFFPLAHAIEKIKKLLVPGGVCIIVTSGRTPFSILHQFFVAKFLRTNLYLYSPLEFYTFLRGTKFSLKSKVINEFEGSYIISLTCYK